MKIIVLHGDDVIKSRQRLEKFIEVAKNRQWDIRRLDDSFMGITPGISATSLFGNESLFLIEDPNSLTKYDLEWIKDKTTKISGNLVIYSDDFLGKRFIGSLPKDIKIEEFKLPKIIFQFLDFFYPENVKGALELLHEVIKYEPIEFVFALLSRHLRNLFWVKMSTQAVPFQSWQIARLKSQASRFGDGRVENIINELSKIDIDVKTSKADLLSSLDLLIITKLQ